MDKEKSQLDETRVPPALDKSNLYFGLLAIVCLVVALVLGFMAAPFTVPGLQWKWAGNLPAFWVSATGWIRSAGYVFMVLYVLTTALIYEKQIVKAFRHRHAVSGMTGAVQILAFIGILGALNYIGVRNPLHWDVTKDKQYSLSEQTKKILKNLKEPVKVTLFIKSGDSYSTNLKTLWSEYKYEAGDRLTLDVIDADREPAIARAENITAYGTSVLQRGTRKTTITAAQEQDLTSALLKVTQSGQKVIYFLTGHGEMSLDSYDNRFGLSNAKDALTKQNYKTDSLTLYSRAQVPSDAALVVVAGPTKPVPLKELVALQNYVDNGGRVFVSLHPATNAGLGDMVKNYGIEVRDDLVLEPGVRNNVQGNMAAPVITKFPYHTVTQGLGVAYFLSSRSLGKAATLPTGVTNVTPLVETSADSWGETNLMERRPQFDAAKDKKGPLPIMMLAEKGKGRLIVAGNSSFLSNQCFSDLNNGDLFLNSLNWMADEESLVSIPPKDMSSKNINFTPWQFQMIMLSSVLVFPLFLLSLAGYVWYRRR